MGPRDQILNVGDRVLAYYNYVAYMQINFMTVEKRWELGQGTIEWKGTLAYLVKLDNGRRWWFYDRELVKLT